MTRLTRSRGTAAIFLALAALIVNPVSAWATPGDYDADGKADLSVALASKNSSTNTGATAWLTRLSSGANPLFWTWNIPADAYVSGRFFVGDSRYYPGIVWVRSSSLPLEWYIKNPSNQDVSLKFGLPGDSITNLGDWDGDGRDDISVVRVGVGDRLFWYVALSGSAQVQVYEWGVKGDKPGLSDVDGDGIAELVVLRPGTYVWYIRKPDGTIVNPEGTQWGLNGDIPLLPTDLDGDHLADFIIVRKEGTLQTAYVKYGNGSTTTIPLGFSTAVPQVGNFTGTPGFAWSQRDTGWVAIQNANASLELLRFGIPQNAIIRADGTAVQPSETGTFPATTTGGGGDSGGGDSGGAASCTQTLSSGWLLKPASQDSGGTREGKPMILYSRNLPRSSCLNVLATNGTIIGKYGKFSSERFYSGYGCGSGLSGSQFAQRALDASGSKNIYLQDPSTGYCAGPGPADGRTDRR